MRLPEPVFPNTDYLPSPAAKLAIDFAVAPTIAGNLFFPELRTCHRRLEMARAAVPEAPVNEYHDPQLRKRKVGSAWDRIVASPPTDP